MKYRISTAITRSLPPLLLCTASLLYASVAWAVEVPTGITQASTVEGITEYRLPNGLKVLLLPDTGKPTVTVNMTYLVGSRHENYGETGMAHLLEHLMFKGSASYPNITQEFNQRGMRMNGTTSLDRTNYFEIFQASDDNLKWAIGMEADRMVNAFIAKKDLDTEMTVVRNEFESGENSPYGVLYKRMQSIAFDWHNYGNSPIGNRSDIENVRIENLQAFYRTYYQPDNAVLLIAGKFDPVKALAWINESFGKVAKPSRNLPQFWTTEPTQDGERSFTVRRKGDVQVIYIGYKTPASLHPDAAALQFMGSILADNPNGRLYKQFVETGKAVQVFAQPLGSYAPGLGLVGAVVKKGEPLEAVRDGLIAAVEDFYKTPPTADEMERVRRDIANGVEKILNDPERIGVTMSEYAALGDWRFFFQGRDRAAAVTAEQVSAAARAYVKRDNRTVGLFIPDDTPDRATIAAAPSVEEAMRSFKPRQDTAVAEEFDPAPANIDRRTDRRQIGGLQVALLPKKTKGETVSVATMLQWGDEKTLFGKRWVASLTRDMLMAGTSRYSKAQLADEMAKLKMTGSVFTFDTTRANLPAALALVAHVLREPSFPEAEFQQLRKQRLVAIESQRNEPQARAAEAMGLHFNRYPKGDFRAAESLDDSIAGLNAVTLDDVRAYHKAFYGASKGELAIVGDFDAEAAAKAIATAFGGWASTMPYTRLPRSFNDIPATRQTLNTPDKENGFYFAALPVELNDEDPDYPALLVANHIFGGAGLNSRVMQRIRQKDGLSYGGGSQLQVDAIDRAGLFRLSAIAAPQNLGKVEAAIREELERATRDGFSAEEVARAQSGLAQQRLQSRTQDRNLAGGWVSYLDLQRSFAWSQALDAKIAALTAAQVNAAFVKHVQPQKLTVIVARDEVKAKAAASQ